MIHILCKPVVVTREGGDHVGLDAFLRCPTCKRSTINHVECWRVDDRVKKALKAEWRARRTTVPTPHRGKP